MSVRVLLVNPPSRGNIGLDDRSVKTAGKKAYLPPLGLITVAALLPSDWILNLVDCAFEEITALQWEECDLVLISGTIVQLDSILETIAEAKRRGKIVAAGGPGIHHFHEEGLRAGADFIVKGEGELTVPLLLEAMEKKDFGRVIESCDVADMTESPIPRFDLLDLDAYVDLTVQFSRGCPFRCEFCDVTMLFGRALRPKAPHQVLEELQKLYDLGWRRQVHFVDDNFVGTPVRSRAFLNELIPWMDDHGRPFEFYTYASVNLAGFPDILELMVRAGFTMVMLGIETVDTETLKAAGKHQNAAVDLDKACAKINRAGLEIVALTMMGFDGEQPNTGERLIDFATRNSIPEICVSLVHALMGTKLWNRLKEEGRLRGGEDPQLQEWHGLGLNFVPTRPVNDIMTEFVHVHEVLYDPQHYLLRAFRHFDSMKPEPMPIPFRFPDLYELRILLLTIWRQGVRYPTRGEFWRLSFQAFLRFSRNRFALFIRACVKMERYMARRKALSREWAKRSSDGVSQDPLEEWKSV